MAEVNSTYELARGQQAPAFELPDGNGSTHTLAEIAEGKGAVVVMFVCNHCPFVVHLASALGEFAKDYASKGVATVAISANDVERYPQDAPVRMVDFAVSNGWDFPYLHDETQEVAKAYGAACTPDFFVLDGDLKLSWAGQFDSSRPGNDQPVTGVDLKAAVDATLAGDASGVNQRPSSGCNIKWKPGNEPSWFG